VLDALVRSRLADSLVHIVERARHVVAIDAVAFERALASIRGHGVDPGLFARHHDLVIALRQGDLACAERLLGEIIALAGREQRLELVHYEVGRLGADFERLPRIMFSERNAGNPLRTLDHAEYRDAAANMEIALNRIAEIDPGIRDEIDALQKRIYVAGHDPGSDHPVFGAVTCFAVWGGCCVNAACYASDGSMTEFFVHEVTHSLLLALSCDSPLVLNPIEESYPSPLRSDPRPMDGIFHALAVCARLTEFHARWRDGDWLTPEERDIVNRAVEENRAAFLAAAAMVEAHARLSELGTALFDEARRAVRETA